MDNFNDPSKYPLTEKQMRDLQHKEMCVHGIPVEVLARANLFVNGS